MMLTKLMFNKSAITGILIVAATILGLLTSCTEEPYIGEVSFDAPVTAIVYETGIEDGEPFAGIVYRRVNDFNKLLAREDTPVLLAFLDESEESDAAIAFIETLADTYHDQLRVVRVNVDYSGNPDDVTQLKELFEIPEYPCFAFSNDGARLGYIPGFSAQASEAVLEKISQLIEDEG